MLELKNISVQFGGIKALAEVSFKVEKNTLFSIIGPNGAGKTTLLNVISGRYKPTSGELYYEGKNLTKLHPNKWAYLVIGRTFQNLALFDDMTVLENIFIGRHHLLRNDFLKGAVYWILGGQKEEVGNRLEAEKILDFLEISDIRKSIAGTLSYGLRKRVELARAIAINPKLILLDEATSGLDSFTELKVLETIKNLNKTVIIDSHRINTLKFCDKVYIIKNNTIKVTKV